MDAQTINICWTVGVGLFTAGAYWGLNKSQTHYLEKKLEWVEKELRELFRHHIESDHPRFDKSIRDAERDLAVLKDRSGRTPSQLAREEVENGKL